MSEELVKKLEELMNTMKDWERKPVLKSGHIVVELVKLPERKTKTTARPAHLAIMIRREDAFRGIIIEEPDELEDLIVAVTTPKLKELVKAVYKILKKHRIQEFEL